MKSFYYTLHKADDAISNIILHYLLKVLWNRYINNQNRTPTGPDTIFQFRGVLALKGLFI